MTVQELIDKLVQVEDKESIVYLEIGDVCFGMAKAVYIEDGDTNITANNL